MKNSIPITVLSLTLAACGGQKAADNDINNADNTGIASTDTGTGSTDTGTGSTDTGTGSTDTGTGSTDTGTGSTDTGTGSTDTGTGSTDTGTGSTDTGTGSTDTGTGSTDTGTGSTDTGTGSTDTGTGSTDTGTGSTDTDNTNNVTVDTSVDPKGLYRVTKDKNYNLCHFKSSNGQRKNQPNRPLVIKHGWDLPQMSFLKNSDGSPKKAFTDQIKARAFDGVTFSVGQLSRSIGRGKYSEAQAEKALSYFDNIDLGDVKENMLILYTYDSGNGYTKKSYENIVNNLRNLARAASKRDSIKGILLDPEFYPSDTFGKTDPWHYSAKICENYTASEDGKADGFVSLADKQKCDIQAYNRGYEAMQAMVEEWPDMKLLTMFGIWTHDARTFNLLNGSWSDPSTGFAPHYEWHHKQGVMPHFLAGMFAATICTDATFTDGTELYGLRKLSDFQTTGKFITDGIVDDNPFLPDNIKEPYRAEVGLGFGIYDDRQSVFAKHAKFPLPKMTPDVWESTIKNAGSVATHYVWLYTEIHDWWNKDPNPWPEVEVEKDPAWINATDSAMKSIKSQ